MNNFPKLTDVASVYNGKAKTCCCGCAGKHKYAAAHVEYASDHRGYKVDPDEVSDRSVKLTYAKVMAAARRGEVDMSKLSDHGFLVYNTDTRINVLYVKS